MITAGFEYTAGAQAITSPLEKCRYINRLQYKAQRKPQDEDHSQRRRTFRAALSLVSHRTKPVKRRTGRDFYVILRVSALHSSYFVFRGKA